MTHDSNNGVPQNVKAFSDRPQSGGYSPIATSEDAIDAIDASAAEESSPSLSLYHLTCLIGYSLSFIIFGSQVSILGPTIKPLAENLGVEETALAPLFTALGISCIISGPPSGWVVDRFPTHHVLIASLLVEAIGFSLVPLMPSVWSLTLLYFVTCFSYNFTNSAVFTSLGWMFPKKAGGSLNLVLAMFGVGSFFIPLAAEGCKQLLGSALDVFWLVGGLSLISTIPFLFVTSPQKPILVTAEDLLNGQQPSPSKTNPSSSSQYPRDENYRNHDENQEEREEGEIEAAEELKSNIRFLDNLTTSSVIFLVFCTTAAETAIGNWLYTYSSNEMGLEDAQAALVNSAFWGAFTAGRVLGVLISPFTTPSILLLSSIPFSLIGSSLPILFSGEMTHTLILTSAILSGLGNSTGYANALALLEQYVPVTGFINGVFGAVAGGACMVGPTLVALLIQHTSLGYTSMAWVGFAFYALHAPAILTAMGAGTRLVALNSSPEDEVNGNGGLGGAGGGEQPVGDLEAEGAHSLATPLLAHRFVRNSHEGHSSLPITVNPSYAEDIRQPRVSLPGHYGSLSRSSTSHRHQGGGGGGGGGGGLAGLTGSSPPSALHHPAPHNSRGVHFGVGSLGSNQGGGVGRGRGGGGSSHETTPPQSNTPTSGSHVAASVFSGVGSLGYLAPGTHDGDGLLGGAAAATGHEDEEAAGFARVSKM